MVHVLIVAKEGLLSSELPASLTAQECRVTSVQGGMAAIQALHQGEPIDAILLGLETLDRSALSLCRAVKEGPAPPKVILLSADKPADDALPPESRPDRWLPLADAGKVWDEVCGVLHLDGASSPLLSEDHEPHFAEVLVAHWRAASTGQLSILAAGVHTEAYLVGGVPVFAEQGSVQSTLGRVLVRRGLITDAQYTQALGRMTERLIESEQVRLGEVLIELGFLKPHEVFEALAEQVRFKLFSCFQHDSVSCHFEEGQEFRAHIVAFEEITFEHLLFEGMGQMSAVALRRWSVPFGRQYPFLSEDPSAIGPRLRLGPDDARYLSAMSGTVTQRETLAASPISEARARRLLACLYLTGLLSYQDAPRARPTAPPERKRPGQRSSRVSLPTSENAPLVREYLRVAGKADHEVLQVAQNASIEEVEQAYAARANSVRPAPGAADEPVISRIAAEVTERMRVARDRLNSRASDGPPLPTSATANKAAQPGPQASKPQPHRRAPVGSSKQRKIEAEKYYQEGLVEQRSKRYAAAHEAFTKAAQMQPDEAEYKLMLSWSQYMSEGHETRRQQARALAAALVRRDFSNAAAHFVLGYCCNLEGDRVTAVHHLRSSVKHDPDNEEAAGMLRLLDPSFDRK